MAEKATSLNVYIWSISDASFAPLPPSSRSAARVLDKVPRYMEDDDDAADGDRDGEGEAGGRSDGGDDRTRYPTLYPFSWPFQCSRGGGFHLMTTAVDPIDSHEISVGGKVGDSDFVTNGTTSDGSPQPN